MQLNRNTALLIQLALSTVQSTGICQSVPQAPQSAVVHSKTYFDPIAAEIAWLNKPWTGDDRPFAALRKQAEQAQQTGDLAAYITAARSEYTKNPASNTAQFKYFYSIWLNQWFNRIHYTYDDEVNQTNFLISLRKSEYPATYNFARMDLLSGELQTMGIKVLPIMERLAKADPNDPIGQHSLAETLSSTDDPVLRERGLQLATTLEAEYPNDPHMQVTLGCACLQCWKLTKDPVTQQRGISCFERYLSLAKPNDYYRPLAQLAIGILEGKQ